ncbi:MAG: hypothetical protein EOP83_37415 [Verrucomicrobiaceae bacterium]|nr:MAG: hypothetical protein EOP83_37415 [Verrucomicrobiaceae bacterium]
MSGDEARAVHSIAAPVIVLTHAASWRMVPDLSDEVMNALEAEERAIELLGPIDQFHRMLCAVIVPERSVDFD